MPGAIAGGARLAFSDEGTVGACFLSYWGCRSLLGFVGAPLQGGFSDKGHALLQAPWYLNQDRPSLLGCVFRHSPGQPETICHTSVAVMDSRPF